MSALQKFLYSKLLFFCIGLLVVTLFAFLYRNLQVSEVWAFGDLAAFPQDITIIENWAFSAWSSQGLGFISFKPFTYYLQMLVFINLLGDNLAQKTMFLLLPIFSFASFYLLLRKLKIGIIASVLGSLIYSVNPITIAELVGGSMTLAVYASFPVILLFILRIVEKDQFPLPDTIFLGLLSFFVLNVHAAFWYLTIIIPVLVFVLYSKKLSLFKVMKRLARFIIPLGIGFLIIFPNALGYMGLYGGTTSSEVTFVPDTTYCYQDASFDNLIRLAGNKGSAQAEEYLNFNTLTHYTILGYIIFLISLVPLLIKKRSLPQQLQPLFLGFIAAFAIGCCIILVIRAFPYVVDLHAIIASLRNPVKLMYPIAFSLCFLFAIGVEKVFLINRFRKKDHIRFLVGFVLSIILISYSYPALDGTFGIGLPHIRDKEYVIEEKYIDLPYILESLDNNYRSYRVMILPWELSTIERVSSYIPNYFGMPTGTAMSSDIEWLQKVFEYTTKDDSDDRSLLIGLFGVKYIVVDKTFTSLFDKTPLRMNMLGDRDSMVYRAHDSYWITGDPIYYIQLFKADPNLSTAYEDVNFIIFKNQNVLEKLHMREEQINSLFSENIQSENLIKNPSFKNGLEHWQYGPSNIINVTNYAEDNEAIVLFGQKDWFTECHQMLSVEENTYYKLLYSVNSHNTTDMHAKVLWYNTTEINNIDNYCQVDYIVPDYEVEKEWLRTEKLLVSPMGAKKAIVWFGANRIGKFSDTALYIDEIEFYKVEKALKNPDKLFYNIQDINYSRSSSTKYVATLNISHPCVIAFSETYNPSWVCYANNEKIPSLILYDSINSFYINKTGNITLTIEYEPQKTFYIACIISIITTVLSLFCLVFILLYKLVTHLKNKRLDMFKGIRLNLRCIVVISLFIITVSIFLSLSHFMHLALAGNYFK